MKGTRKERIEKVLDILRENNGEMEFKDIYGEMALTYGLTKRTFSSYLDALKAAGKIDYPEIVLIAREDEFVIKLKT